MADRDDIHLPSPSALPVVLSLGIALALFGFVPDSRLWRLALVSIGATIVGAATWLWVRDALGEYRGLD
jgi:hypothetical protein